MPETRRPIGIFDSGYGGLTVFKEINRKLPDYDFVYLGDNARAPYGSRNFETVYRFTLQCVNWFFEQGCPLVILACNTASAKALRSIQQNDLKYITDPENRVLGVIRPTSEVIGSFTRSGHIGLLATKGTVTSDSYPIEVAKFWPDVHFYQHACPMWVPLIENQEYNNPGAFYFYEKDLKSLFDQSANIDTILLGCTHYPVLRDILEKLIPKKVQIISQDSIVADSLCDYLNRHEGLNQKITKESYRAFYTTGSTYDFDQHSPLFYGQEINSKHIDLSI
jgi:glutamate racemase